MVIGDELQGVSDALNQVVLLDHGHWGAPLSGNIYKEAPNHDPAQRRKKVGEIVPRRPGQWPPAMAGHEKGAAV
jgi:hypothetical protein